MQLLIPSSRRLHKTYSTEISLMLPNAARTTYLWREKTVSPTHYLSAYSALLCPHSLNNGTNRVLPEKR